MLAIWIAGDLPAVGFEHIWRTWWLSDLAGALVVTPAMLTWARARVRLTTRQMIEGAALIAVLLVLTDPGLAPRRAVRAVPRPDLGRAPLRAARSRLRAAGGIRADDLGHLRAARARSCATR